MTDRNAIGSAVRHRVDDHHPEGGPRGPRHLRRASRLRRFAIAAVGVLAGALAIGAGIAPATAQGDGFAITSYQDGQFVSGSTLDVEGTAEAGRTVDVTATGGSSCSSPVGRDGTWSCTLGAPNGTVTVTAALRTGTSTPAPDPDPSDSGSAAASSALRPAPDAADSTSASDAAAAASAAAASDSAAAASDAAPAVSPTAPSSDPTSDPTDAPTDGATGAPAPGGDDELGAPNASAASVSITLHVLGAPSIDAGPVGTLLHGTGYPGAILLLALTRDDVPEENECAVVATDGTWSCAIDLPTGAWTASVRQHVPGHPEQSSPSSDPQTIQVDRDAPPPPVITSPTQGARVGATLTVAGTGEDGDSVSVFLDGSLVCSAPVRGGAFSCGPVSLDGDSGSLVALQRDAVGNYSARSAAVTVFAASAAAPSPTPRPSSPSSAAPGTGGGRSTQASPVAPGRPLTHDWAAPTGFGSTLPTVSTAFSGSAPLLGLTLSAVFVVLIALPLRLLRTAAGPNVPAVLPAPPSRRHRERVRESRASGGSLGWMAGGWIAVIVVAAGLQGRAEYARMLIAALLGLGVLNLVGIAAVGAIAAAVTRARLVLRIDPLLLVLGAAGVVVSTLLGLSPALLLGLVLTALPLARPGRVLRAGVVPATQMAQLAVTEALAVAAWVAHGEVGGVDVWGFGLRETLATIAISGLYSTALQLLPLGRLPGRAIFERAPLGWLAAAVAAVTVAVVAVPPTDASGIAIMVGVAIAIGVACLAGWLWLRWVSPALAARH